MEMNRWASRIWDRVTMLQKYVPDEILLENITPLLEEMIQEAIDSVEHELLKKETMLQMKNIGASTAASKLKKLADTGYRSAKFRDAFIESAAQSIERLHDKIRSLEADILVEVETADIEIIDY